MIGFETALEVVLGYEGGLVDDPDDPGGLTNFGISQRSYPDVDIRNLTRDGAANIYQRDFYTPLKCDQLPFPIALGLFDFAVNSGITHAVEALQRACLVTDDGVMGPQTIAAANTGAKASVVERFTTERILYYAGLFGFVKYGRGWTRRAVEVMGTSLLLKDAL